MARRKSQKSRQDPNKPKRGKSAWQSFSSDNREDVKKQNPGLSGREITEKLSEMWRQCDDATKRRYQKQFQSIQAEYDQKLTAYKDEQNKKKRGSSKSKKDTEETKKGSHTEQTPEYNDPM